MPANLDKAYYIGLVVSGQDNTKNNAKNPKQLYNQAFSEAQKDTEKNYADYAKI